MAKNQFAAAHFHDEEAARVWFEAARWPNGPICPKCGSEKHYATKKLGRYRCAAPTCRKDFTVQTGTVMERSHAKLTQWAVAFHLGASSKKGFSAHQLHRELGCQYNTAWFLHHRVMEAMRRGGLDLPPMGGEGKVVEADETYYGNVDRQNRRETRTRGAPFLKKGKRGGPANKRPIVALVERDGNVRTFHVPVADKNTVTKIVRENMARESRLHTDESKLYSGSDQHFGAHKTVTHSHNEYVRYEDGEAIHTNTAEGYFSIFKRGMRGVYQHCKEKHLHRYLAEFDFRYNYRASLGFNDTDRTIAAVRGGEGKRLTYHQSH
ncbi:MAG: IS1595 family transposase [Steroidobacteraceae bacterium]|jgi:transposase-like protein